MKPLGYAIRDIALAFIYLLLCLSVYGQCLPLGIHCDACPLLTFWSNAEGCGIRDCPCLLESSGIIAASSVPQGVTFFLKLSPALWKRGHCLLSVFFADETPQPVVFPSWVLRAQLSAHPSSCSVPGSFFFLWLFRTSLYLSCLRPTKLPESADWFLWSVPRNDQPFLFSYCFRPHLVILSVGGFKSCEPVSGHPCSGFGLRSARLCTSVFYQLGRSVCCL